MELRRQPAAPRAFTAPRGPRGQRLRRAPREPAATAPVFDVAVAFLDAVHRAKSARRSDRRAARQASHRLRHPAHPRPLRSRPRRRARRGPGGGAQLRGQPRPRGDGLRGLGGGAHGAACAPGAESLTRWTSASCVRRTLDEDGHRPRPDDAGHRARRRRGPGHPPGQGRPGGLGPRRRAGSSSTRSTPARASCPAWPRAYPPGRATSSVGGRPGARPAAGGARGPELPAAHVRHRDPDARASWTRWRARRARIRDTRKTTPLLRALEKRAVVVGGGVPHRSGLDSAILVKDNHVRMAGSVGEATRRAVAAAGGLAVEIEVERAGADRGGARRRARR